MFDIIKSLISNSSKEDIQVPQLRDIQLCSAALLVYVLAADGVVKANEEKKIREIVSERFGLSAEETNKLYEQAKTATSESVDLYGFTRNLKFILDEEERIALVRNLWDIVYADGHLHELEDNIVWRIAELLGVSSRDRMLAKHDAVKDSFEQS